MATAQHTLIYEQHVLGTTHLNMKSVFLPLVLLVLGGSCYAQPFRIVGTLIQRLILATGMIPL